MVESRSALPPGEDPAPGGARSERLRPIEALEAVILTAPPDLARGIAATPEDFGTEGLQPATVVGMAMFVAFAVYHAIAVPAGPRGPIVVYDLALVAASFAVKMTLLNLAINACDAMGNRGTLTSSAGVIELACRLREKWSGLPMLFVTGHSADRVARSGAVASHDRVLEKRYQLTELTHTIRHVLQARSTRATGGAD